MIRIAVIFFVLGGLAGCDRTPSGAVSKGASTKIEVLATVYPLAEMVQRVGGGPAVVDVQWLAEGNQRPEEVRPTPEMQQRANRAAMVVTSGPWDAWAGANLTEEARNARLIAPERMPAGRGADQGAYLWLDPAVAKELVEAVRLKLTVIDPSREVEYRANAAAYAAEMEAVAREWEGVRGAGAGRVIVAVRPVWDALGKRFGVMVVAPVSGVTEATLSVGDFRALARFAKENGARAIVVDVATPAAIRQQIEEKTGLRVVMLDALGTSAAEGRNTLAKVLRYDLEQVKRALE